MWHICVFRCRLLLNMMASNLITSKKEPIGPDVLSSHIWSASGGRIENTMISLYFSLWLLRNWLSECPSRHWSNIVNSAVFQNKSCFVTFILLHHHINLLQGHVSILYVYLRRTLIIQHINIYIYKYSKWSSKEPVVTVLHKNIDTSLDL